MISSYDQPSTTGSSRRASITRGKITYDGRLRIQYAPSDQRERRLETPSRLGGRLVHFAPHCGRSIDSLQHEEDLKGLYLGRLAYWVRHGQVICETARANQPSPRVAR